VVIGWIKWGKGFFNKLLHRITRYQPNVPRETLRIITIEDQCSWGNGTVKNQPAMQVIGNWHITNIIDSNVIITKVCIKETKTVTSIMIQHPSRNNYGDFPILANSTARGLAMFWIVPPIKNTGKDFKATVVFTDQFGNDHQVKNIIFKSLNKEQLKKPNPKKKESLYSIQDSIEKNVASVLKVELERYRKSGRERGGLGSIQTTYEEKDYLAVVTGNETFGPSPKQGITLNPEQVSINSDNATTLLQ